MMRLLTYIAIAGFALVVASSIAAAKALTTEEQDELELARMRARVDGELARMENNQREDIAAQEARLDREEELEREEALYSDVAAVSYGPENATYAPAWGWRYVAKAYGTKSSHRRRHHQAPRGKACPRPAPRRSR
jgi:hypothetical protein